MNIARIAACLPVDTSTLPDIDIPLPVPTVLYSITQCQGEDCGQDIWIGPRQKSVAEADPTIRVLCYKCAVTATVDADLNLVNLGGGAGVEGRPRW